MPHYQMKRVGITGGIGCGKSTVAAEFVKIGVSCFVADNIAAAYYNEPDFLADLRKLLGNNVFNADGSADKAAIARRVFADKALLQQLNSLIHPRVMRDFNRFCTAHESEPYVLFESAILYDYGFDKMMDCVNQFHEILNNMPQSEAAFQIAKDAAMKQIASQRTTKFSILNAYINAQRLGLDYDIYKKIYELLPSLSLQDIVNFEQQNMGHKPYRYIILGDEKELDIKALEQIAPVKRLTLEEIFGY